jgi:hypothetical protein
MKKIFSAFYRKTILFQAIMVYMLFTIGYKNDRVMNILLSFFIILFQPFGNMVTVESYASWYKAFLLLFSFLVTEILFVLIILFFIRLVRQPRK